MNEISKRFHGWRAVVAIIMLSAGTACYVISCIAAMILARKDG